MGKHILSLILILCFSYKLQAFTQKHAYTSNITIEYKNLSSFRDAIYLLEEIRKTDIGFNFITAISLSQNTLIIKEDNTLNTLVKSGSTKAEMSTKVFGGPGVSAEIFFNFKIPESGCHLVEGDSFDYIHFYKIHNFFHELVHGYQYTTGSLGFDTLVEKDAVYKTNMFREQYFDINHNILPFKRALSRKAKVSPVCGEGFKKVVDLFD